MELADFSLDAFSLSGRAALVTGGNTGLGRAISVALAAAGADLCVVSVEDDDGVTRDLVTGHDRRYAIDDAKLRALGWSPAVSLEEGLRATVDWYRDNRAWWER